MFSGGLFGAQGCGLQDRSTQLHMVLQVGMSKRRNDVHGS
jgi:hypothetical protein